MSILLFFVFVGGWGGDGWVYVLLSVWLMTVRLVSYACNIVVLVGGGSSVVVTMIVFVLWVVCCVVCDGVRVGVVCGLDGGVSRCWLCCLVL